jgi:hypothetical protein
VHLVVLNDLCCCDVAWVWEVLPDHDFCFLTVSGITAGGGATATATTTATAATATAIATSAATAATAVTNAAAVAITLICATAPAPSCTGDDVTAVQVANGAAVEVPTGGTVA